MTPTEFDAWCAAKARQHGDRWDPSGLAAEFVPFFDVNLLHKITKEHTR